MVTQWWTSRCLVNMEGVALASNRSLEGTIFAESQRRICLCLKPELEQVGLVREQSRPAS